MPRALSPKFLAEKGVKTMPRDGIHSVTVPGAVGGWWALHQKFGKLPWKDLFQAAIAYGEEGFPVTEAIVESWASAGEVKKLKADPESARVFFGEGQSAGGRGCFSQSGLGESVPIDRGEGARCVLQG